MKQTVYEYQFIDEMSKDVHGFSYQGARALYNYFLDFEDDTYEMDFDPIAIRCEWSEYDSLDEIKEDYEDIETIEDLENNTSVIEFDGGIIIQQF
jgi:hypothetical protein